MRERVGSRQGGWNAGTGTAAGFGMDGSPTKKKGPVRLVEMEMESDDEDGANRVMGGRAGRTRTAT